MKSPRLWIVLFGTMVAALAIQPAGKLWLRTEIEQRTHSHLSIGHCQFNLLSGGLLIQGLRAEHCSPGKSESSEIKIAKIWTKGSLNQLLYRKLSAPLTVMDGVALELSSADENPVPVVHPVSIVDNGLLSFNANQVQSVGDVLHQAFLSTQKGLQENLSIHERIAHQISELENRSLRIDNPLRDRDVVSTTQESILRLQQELKDSRLIFQKSHDRFHEEYDASSRMIPCEKPTSTLSGLDCENEAKAIDNTAKNLTEHLVCSAVDQMKPYLGLSTVIVRQWLLENNQFDKPAKNGLDKSSTTMTRGKTYRFNTAMENEILFGSIRFRGAAKIDAKQFPFNGHLKNIGSQSLDAKDRPSLDLVFSNSSTQDKEDTPWVALNAGIIPDRQGFLMQSQLIPSGTMIASTAQGDWQIAAFGQNSMISLAWLVHQSEWSLEIEIRSSQSEVVVKQKESTRSDIGTPLMPRFEPCFTSHDSVCLAKAMFKGNLVFGEPHQQSMVLESPILERLSESMLKQHRTAMELSRTKKQEQAEFELKQKWVNYESEIEKSHSQLAKSNDQLQARLQQHQSKVAEWLRDRDELRFSREKNENVQR